MKNILRPFPKKFEKCAYKYFEELKILKNVLINFSKTIKFEKCTVKLLENVKIEKQSKKISKTFKISSNEVKFSKKLKISKKLVTGLS